jgi:hypothetical protein
MRNILQVSRIDGVPLGGAKRKEASLSSRLFVDRFAYREWAFKIETTIVEIVFRNICVLCSDDYST